MLNTRSRLVALVATLVFCAQIFAPGIALAQTAPEPPHAESFTTSTTAPPSMSVESASEMHAEFPPTGIQPNPMPEQGTISAEMVTVLSNAVTSAGHVVIDFGSLAGGVLDHGTNNFANTGTIYAISTNPEITTATIAAQNIFNQTGATITTILPEGGLTGYSNLVSGLNLSLAAVESVVNAGTISSAGNLNITAGTSIINALPSMLPPEILASTPIMQATNNLNLVSSNITNAGVMESVASSINVSTPTAQSIVFNNVGGTLSALDAINVRDASFAGKFNTLILGGNILAERLNVYSGDGLAKIQVDNLTPALTLLAGDGYVSTLSDLRIATVVYTGDPIHVSGGDVVFESDEDENGNKTGIVTGGGTFSGRNAKIGEGVHTINISGAILTLSGNANLSSLPISVASSLKIDAEGSINTSDIGAGSAIILNSSGGSITTGTLTAGSYIQLRAPAGAVNSGSLTSSAGGVIVHGTDIHVGTVRSQQRPGFIDIKAQTGSPLKIGGENAHIASIQMTGVSPTQEAWINIENPNGITLDSPFALSISTAATRTGLSFSAQNGTVTLPKNTSYNFDSDHPSIPAGNFSVSAQSLIADGLKVTANGGDGQGGFIFLGANSIDRGSEGFDLHTDGGLNVGAGIGIGGRRSVNIQTQLGEGFNFRQVLYSGSVADAFELKGSGPVVGTANGTIIGGNIFVDSDSTATLSGGRMTFSANATEAGGHGGFVQVTNRAIVNTSQGISLSANGMGTGTGGLVEASAYGTGSDLTLGPDKLTLSATGGPRFGTGLNARSFAGRHLTVAGGPADSAPAIMASTTNATGGRVDIGGGFAGQGNVTILGSVLANGGTTGGSVIVRHRSTSTTVPGVIMDSGVVEANGTAFGGTITINNHESGPLQIQQIGDSRLSATNTNDDGQMGQIVLRHPGRLVSLFGTGQVTGGIVADGSAVGVSTTAPGSVLTLRNVNASATSARIFNTGVGGRIDVAPSTSATAAVSAATVVELQADKLNIGIADGSDNAASNRGANGFIKAHDVVLRTNSSSTQSGSGDIRMGTSVLADGTVTVTAHGNGQLRSFDGKVSGQTVHLSGDDMSGVGDGYFVVWTDNLKVTASHDDTGVAINNSDPLNPSATRDLNVLESVWGDNVDLRVSGDALVFAPITTNLLNILATENIQVGAPLRADSNMTLAAGIGENNSGHIVQVGGTASLTSNAYVLSAKGGTIGDPIDNLRLTAIQTDDPARLEIRFSEGTVDAYLKQLNPVDLQIDRSVVDHVFSLVNNGAITQSKLQSGSTVLKAGDARLTSIALEHGNIGSSNINNITIDANFLTARTATGAVFIDNLREDPLHVRPSTSYGPFSVHTPSGMVVYEVKTTSATGTISLVSERGVLEVLPGAVIDGASKVTLQVRTVAPESKIVLGTSSQVLCNSPANPEIFIVIGDLTGPGFSPVEWQNVQFTRNGGDIVFGNSAIFADAPTNNMIANGGLIYLTPAVPLDPAGPSGSIELKGGVLIRTDSFFGNLHPRGGQPAPGKGGTPPGQSAPPPGQNQQSNPGSKGQGTPHGQGGDVPGTSLPPPGQNASASPAQGIPIPPGQEQRLKVPPEKQPVPRSNHLQPVSFVVSSAPTERNLASNYSAECNGLRILHDGTAHLFRDDSTVTIESGEFVAVANQRTNIQSDECTIYLSEGSVVVIDRDDEVTTVHCLHSPTTKSIRVRAESQEILIASGETLTIGRESKNTLPFGIARRREHALSMPNSKKARLAEFSPVSLYANSASLRLLKESTNPSDRSAFKQVMKTAACLATVTASHGPYKSRSSE